MNCDDDLPDEVVHLTPASGNLTASDAVLKERILMQTIGVVRRRRRFKRLGFAVALAACYLAGMGTLAIWRGNASTERETVANADVLPSGSDAAGRLGSITASPNDRLLRPEDDGIFPNEKQTQAQAAVAKLTSYDRLHMAGDRQLEVENDIAAAAHTYRQALQVATGQQRSISVDNDSWLMMAMKSDQNRTIAENTQ